MSLFPFVNTDTQEVNISTTKIPVEYEYDFLNNRLTGRKVEGIEAIRVWILKVLKSERYRHLIYSFDYGIELEKFIGKNYNEELIRSELARNIEEALKINPYIKDVDGFESAFSGTTITCKFTVITEFGEVEINV